MHTASRAVSVQLSSFHGNQQGNISGAVTRANGLNFVLSVFIRRPESDSRCNQPPTASGVCKCCAAKVNELSEKEKYSKADRLQLKIFLLFHVWTKWLLDF